MPKTNRRRTTHRKRTSQQKRKNVKKTAIKQRGGNTSVYYLVTPFKPNTRNAPTTIHLTTKIARPTMEEKIQMFRNWLVMNDNATFINDYYFSNSEDNMSPEFYINNVEDYKGSMEDPVRVEISQRDKTFDPRNIYEF